MINFQSVLTPISDDKPLIAKIKIAEGYLMHITGGARESTNPFGHTALAVDGVGMYSYGNNTRLGSDPLMYIQEQSRHRVQIITIIPVTKKQHDAVLQYFQSKGGMNSIGLVDNCAVRTIEALLVAGMKIDAAPFPGDVARSTMRLPNVQNFNIPKNGAIPNELSIIIRKKFTPPQIP